jgi:formate hydrogenlyase subunit 3/multisubunit Na+/H+ antiporter MnhD subunit
MNKKHLFTSLTLLTLLLTSQLLYAQGGAGNGTAGIQDATTQVTSYFDPLTRLMYAIGAVLGLVGAIKVYGKWNSGDQDTQKTAVSWFGSMIFLVIVATVVRSFFL